jgi:hypothetical protein
MFAVEYKNGKVQYRAEATEKLLSASKLSEDANHEAAVSCCNMANGEVERWRCPIFTTFYATILVWKET